MNRWADYVIVGAGAAGCVLANRLSADPGVSVLLVEAGPPDRKLELHIPAAFSKLFRTEVDWSYDTVPQPNLAGRSIYWPRGKVLGGSSSINAMMWVRGYAADYDCWGELAGADWAYHRIEKYFGQIDSVLHIERQRSPRSHTATFLEAARECSLPFARVNSPQPDGVAQTLVNQQRGRRFSAADGYLAPVRTRPNLTVLTNAQVTRVLFETAGSTEDAGPAEDAPSAGGARRAGSASRRPRATGIEYLINGARTSAGASREVILAGGAVNSPQLLMLSGVGDGRALTSLGIPVVADRPAVGQNLMDHLVTGLIVAVPGDTLFNAEKPKQLADFLLRRQGMLTSNVAEAYGFVRSRDDLPLPDLELIFAPVAFVGQGLEPPPAHGITLGVLLEQPESRGTITLASADPLAAPLIDPRYLSDRAGADRNAMLAGLALADRMLHSRAFHGIVGDYLVPLGAAGMSAAERYRVAVDEYAHTMYHPVGTCRMGSDEHSVVDPELRVRGVERLRVVDASVMPVIIRGHTQAPSLVIAERAAELIRADAS